MSERIQEKIGWIGGWSGGFIWVVILSVVLLFKGQTLGAVGWGVYTLGGPENMGFSSWWSLAILFPVLLPLWTVGNRRWDDEMRGH
jgi:hypothetical protein